MNFKFLTPNVPLKSHNLGKQYINGTLTLVRTNPDVLWSLLYH